MWYGFLADLVVAVHVAYVSYVLFGQIAIFLGMALKWPWIRNPWFRITHLAAIVIVALEAVGNIDCPLTKLECHFRVLAGQPVVGDTFVGRMLHQAMFWDCPGWVFTPMYITFALVVLGTFLFVPPRRQRARVSS